MDNQTLKNTVEAYLKTNGDSEEQENILRKIRKDLAVSFLDKPENEQKFPLDGPIKEKFNLILKAGLTDLPRNDDETALTGRILQAWTHQFETGVLLSAMLMLRAFELPKLRRFSEIPESFRIDYARYLLTPPGVFNTEGEADRFADFFKKAVSLFHEELLSEDGVPETEAIHNLFVNQANFIQFYFNEKNLRSTYRKRAQIMEAWALKQGAELAYLPLFRQHKKNSGERKTKVGILSAHFSPQTEVYLMLSYFDRLPKELFSVTLYSLKQTNHPLEKYCRSRTDQFVVLPESHYPDKVNRIRSDEIDILLIGTNTSAVSNPITIMAMFRMAGIHVIFENSPVSTGFTHTDYYLTSYYNEPGGDAQSYYTERLYRVNGLINYYAYHHDNDQQTVSINRKSLNIPEECVVYFSGANFYKILPELSQLWVQILERTPDSRLILVPFNPNWTSRYLSAPFIRRIREQMRERDVDFERIHILERLPTRADVHALMSVCDIYLDSFPYAGACSLIDPLTVGLPIVCHAGSTMRGSFAASMLKAAGLDEMIAPDAGSYLNKAVALGNDASLRKRRREMIKTSLSHYHPFYDTAACGAKIAGAFQSMMEERRLSVTRLLCQSAFTLKQQIIQLSTRLAETNNLFFRNFAGSELTRLLLLPYFRSIKNDISTLHVMDVIAGDGGFSTPFLNAGAHSDLLEINPAWFQHIDSIVRRFPGHAVFHQNAGDASIGERIRKCDILRVGVGGWSVNLVFPGDHHQKSPRMIVLEFDQKAGRGIDTWYNLDTILESFGYTSIIFSYVTGPGNSGRRKLKDIRFGLRNSPEAECGSILYLKKDDTTFLFMLDYLLNDFFSYHDRQYHHIKASSNSPLVSICIPTFNGEQFISETLSSALAQTYRPIEIIISDDGSSDQTLEIIKSFQNQSSTAFKIFPHENLGLVRNWNFCISKSNGKYIKFLHQDDLLEPDCVEKMVNAAEQCHNTGLVFSSRGLLMSGGAEKHNICCSNFNYARDTYKNWSDLKSVQDGQDLLKDPNLLENPINKVGEPTTVLLSREALEKAGFFETDLCQLVDVEMWLRIMKSFKICFVNETLSHWRLHPSQTTCSNASKTSKIILDYQKFYKKIINDLQYPQDLRYSADQKLNILYSRYPQIRK